MPLDWIPADPELAQQAVTTYGKLVFLGNFGNTWAGPVPFDEMMRRRGALLACDCELDEDHYLVVNISCLASDEDTAQEIVGKVQVKDKEGKLRRMVRFPGLGNIAPGQVFRSAVCA